MGSFGEIGVLCIKRKYFPSPRAKSPKNRPPQSRQDRRSGGRVAPGITAVVIGQGLLPGGPAAHRGDAHMPDAIMPLEQHQAVAASPEGTLGRHVFDDAQGAPAGAFGDAEVRMRPWKACERRTQAYAGSGRPTRTTWPPASSVGEPHHFTGGDWARSSVLRSLPLLPRTRRRGTIMATLSRESEDAADDDVRCPSGSRERAPRFQIPASRPEGPARARTTGAECRPWTLAWRALSRSWNSSSL